MAKQLYTVIVLTLIFCNFHQWGYAQSGICDPSTPFETADLTSDPTMTWVSSNERRSGTCCGNPASGCIEFEVTLHPDAMGIQLDIFSGTIPGGAPTYEINCGTSAVLGDPLCVTGTGPLTVTFCASGSSFNRYSIQSIPKSIFTVDATVRENCSGQLTVAGLEESTIVWNDITSGTGAYNSYLDCTSACSTPTFSAPVSGAPSTIEYQVCGEAENIYCSNSAPMLCDTLTVTVEAAFSLSVSPNPGIACSGTGDPLPTLMAQTSILSYNYNYFWYNGANGSGTQVGTSSSYTPTSVGTYSVIVEDQTLGSCTRQLVNVDVYFDACVEICDNELDDDGDGLVDSFDPDCPCDPDEFFGQCDPDCDYTPPVGAAFDITAEWVSDSSVIALAPIVAGDLDGDGVTEVIAIRESPSGQWSQPNGLMIFDGTTGALKYKPNTYNILYKNKGIAIADADRDGRGEIYYMIAYEAGATLRRRIACYEYDPGAINPAGTGTGSFTLQWTSSTQVTCGLAAGVVDNADAFSVNVADFNYDGIPEVYVGNEIFNALNGQLIATGGANSIGSLVTDYSTHAHPHAYVVAADVLPETACPDCGGLGIGCW